MKKPELAIPKSDSKKERKDAHRASQAVRKANREECLRLDGYKCRNPFCGCSQINTMECALIDSHHIVGRTKDNRYDGVEYRISLSRKCHTLVDKNRVEMLRILKELKRTASDFRWLKSIKELEKMI